jgi:hypothetical protein
LLRTNLRKEVKKFVGSKEYGAGIDEMYEPGLSCFKEMDFLIVNHRNGGGLRLSSRHEADHSPSAVPGSRKCGSVHMLPDVFMVFCLIN